VPKYAAVLGLKNGVAVHDLPENVVKAVQAAATDLLPRADLATSQNHYCFSRKNATAVCPRPSALGPEKSLWPDIPIPWHPTSQSHAIASKRLCFLSNYKKYAPECKSIPKKKIP
jgi:hypothetical protein